MYHDDDNAGTWYEFEVLMQKSRIDDRFEQLQARYRALERRAVRRRWRYLAVRLVVSVSLFLALLTLLPWWAALCIAGGATSIIVEAT